MSVVIYPSFPWLKLRSISLLNCKVWMMSGASVPRIREETQTADVNQESGLCHGALMQRADIW